MQGKLIEIVRASYGVGTRRVVIMIDVSGSMQGEAAGFGLVVVEAFVAALSAHDSLGLIVFGERIEDSLPLGSQPEAMIGTIQQLRQRRWPPSKTALFDALAAGLALLKPPQPGDAIYLFTDGFDNSSHLTEASFDKMAERANARIFCFVPLPAGVGNRTPESAAGPPFLHSLSSDTGGEVVTYWFRPGELTGVADGKVKLSNLLIGDQQTLNEATNIFARLIDNSYQLQIHLAEPLDRPRPWKLDLVSTAGLPAKHLRLVYPKRLAVCDTQ